ncbi:hypothetical protein [Ligilactobacillus salivarius]|uniref:hypothetical protein n=1 Tax=Ligilactobacillus salivarius TaxID=1624 RepID=UPI0009DABC88|nr:hypothetical protein [Ligilactobacillus salivarius]OQR18997.1 hypothetical protein B6U39_09135 [Ligilactobacillus salivarius]
MAKIRIDNEETLAAFKETEDMIANDDSTNNKANSDLVTPESIAMAEREIKTGKVKKFMSVDDFEKYLKGL